jgi:hypothetical protein
MPESRRICPTRLPLPRFRNCSWQQELQLPTRTAPNPASSKDCEHEFDCVWRLLMIQKGTHRGPAFISALETGCSGRDSPGYPPLLANAVSPRWCSSRTLNEPDRVLAIGERCLRPSTREQCSMRGETLQDRCLTIPTIAHK